MNKKINMIIGTGVLGAYLAQFLLKNNETVIVTSRYLKRKFKNYNFLKIEKKVKFIKLNIYNKKDVEKNLKEYNPKKIFYFAGQSSITKSINNKKETIRSHFNGTKNFLNNKKKKIKFKIF